MSWFLLRGDRVTFLFEINEPSPGTPTEKKGFIEHQYQFIGLDENINLAVKNDRSNFVLVSKNKGSTDKMTKDDIFVIGGK